MSEEHNNINSGGIIGLIILALIGWWFYNTFLKPDIWQANFEASYQAAVGVGPKFDSKEACLTWMHEQQLSPRGRYNFECGSNCQAPKTELGPWRCDESVD